MYITNLINAGAAALASNPFSGLAEWFTNLSDGVRTLFPVIGTLAIIVIAIVIAVAGSQWSQKAKALLGGLIVAIALAAYGPSLLTSLYESGTNSVMLLPIWF